MKCLQQEEYTPTGLRPAGNQQAAPPYTLAAAELIRRRRSWLVGKDRLIIEMIYLRGSSCQDIAALLEMQTSSVSRRLRKVTNRLIRPEYPICLQHRRKLSPLELKIARDWFAAGLNRKIIARQYGISLYRVDCHLRRLKKLIEKHKSKTKNLQYTWKEGA